MANKEISSKYGNESSLEERGWVDSITTTNATLTPWFSIPVAQNKSVTLNLNFDARKSDYSIASGGYIITKFARGTGNLIQQGTSINDVLTSFIGQKPAVTIVANISTQSIDVSVTGILSTTITWSGDYYLKYNS